MRDGNPLRARAEAHIAAMSRRTAADHDRLAEILAGPLLLTERLIAVATK